LSLLQGEFCDLTIICKGLRRVFPIPRWYHDASAHIRFLECYIRRNPDVPESPKLLMTGHRETKFFEGIRARAQTESKRL
jgi:hypothetical protein